jgi:hypothetical protein
LLFSITISISAIVTTCHGYVLGLLKMLKRPLLDGFILRDAFPLKIG